MSSSVVAEKAPKLRSSTSGTAHCFPTHPPTRYKVQGRESPLIYSNLFTCHYSLGGGEKTLEFRLKMAGTIANSKSIRNEDKASLRF